MSCSCRGLQGIQGPAGPAANVPISQVAFLSLTGNDATGQLGNMANPFRTFPAAVQAASTVPTGGTVFVSPGDYEAGDITITNSLYVVGFQTDPINIVVVQPLTINGGAVYVNNASFVGKNVPLCNVTNNGTFYVAEGCVVRVDYTQDGTYTSMFLADDSSYIAVDVASAILNVSTGLSNTYSLTKGGKVIVSGAVISITTPSTSGNMPNILLFDEPILAMNNSEIVAFVYDNVMYQALTLFSGTSSVVSSDFRTSNYQTSNIGGSFQIGTSSSTLFINMVIRGSARFNNLNPSPSGTYDILWDTPFVPDTGFNVNNTGSLKTQGLSTAAKEVYSDYQIVINDYLIVYGGSGNASITLPAKTQNGAIYVIYNDSDSTVTIYQGDGTEFYTLASHSSVTIHFVNSVPDKWIAY